MAMKSFILIPILIVVFVGTQAEAQLPPLIPPTTAGALFNITGIVLCSANSNVYNVITPTPPFPNATVQLSCGGNVIDSTTTNGMGRFGIRVQIQSTLATVLSSCKANVVTPLSACNAALPSTTPSLEASLQFGGVLVNTTLLTTRPFQVMASL